jgi:hypothetical protein
MEEVAIWNRALSVGEVKELFNKGASRLGVKYRSCNDSACSGESWSDTNYSAGSQINLTGLTSNRYFQYGVYPTLYRFPDGNYLPTAFPTFRDLNVVYTN